MGNWNDATRQYYRTPEEKIAALEALERLGQILDTWSSCPECGAMWKEERPVEGVLCQVSLCETCNPANKARG